MLNRLNSELVFSTWQHHWKQCEATVIRLLSVVETMPSQPAFLDSLTNWLQEQYLLVASQGQSMADVISDLVYVMEDAKVGRQYIEQVQQGLGFLPPQHLADEYRRKAKGGNGELLNLDGEPYERRKMQNKEISKLYKTGYGYLKGRIKDPHFRIEENERSLLSQNIVVLELQLFKLKRELTEQKANMEKRLESELLKQRESFDSEIEYQKKQQKEQLEKLKRETIAREEASKQELTNKMDQANRERSERTATKMKEITQRLSDEYNEKLKQLQREHAWQLEEAIAQTKEQREAETHRELRVCIDELGSIVRSLREAERASKAEKQLIEEELKKKDEILIALQLEINSATMKKESRETIEQLERELNRVKEEKLSLEQQYRNKIKEDENRAELNLKIISDKLASFKHQLNQKEAELREAIERRRQDTDKINRLELEKGLSENVLESRTSSLMLTLEESRNELRREQSETVRWRQEAERERSGRHEVDVAMKEYLEIAECLKKEREELLKIIELLRRNESEVLVGQHRLQLALDGLKHEKSLAEERCQHLTHGLKQLQSEHQLLKSEAFKEKEEWLRKLHELHKKNKEDEQGHLERIQMLSNLLSTREKDINGLKMEHLRNIELLEKQLRSCKFELEDCLNTRYSLELELGSLQESLRTKQSSMAIVEQEYNERIQKQSKQIQELRSAIAQSEEGHLQTVQKLRAEFGRSKSEWEDLASKRKTEWEDRQNAQQSTIDGYRLSLEQLKEKTQRLEDQLRQSKEQETTLTKLAKETKEEHERLTRVIQLNCVRPGLAVKQKLAIGHQRIYPHCTLEQQEPNRPCGVVTLKGDSSKVDVRLISPFNQANRKATNTKKQPLRNDEGKMTPLGLDDHGTLLDSLEKFALYLSPEKRRSREDTLLKEENLRKIELLTSQLEAIASDQARLEEERKRAAIENEALRAKEAEQASLSSKKEAASLLQLSTLEEILRKHEEENKRKEALLRQAEMDREDKERQLREATEHQQRKDEEIKLLGEQQRAKEEELRRVQEESLSKEDAMKRMEAEMAEKAREEKAERERHEKTNRELQEEVVRRESERQAMEARLKREGEEAEQRLLKEKAELEIRLQREKEEAEELRRMELLAVEQKLLKEKQEGEERLKREREENEARLKREKEAEVERLKNEKEGLEERHRQEKEELTLRMSRERSEAAEALQKELEERLRLEEKEKERREKVRSEEEARQLKEKEEEAKALRAKEERERKEREEALEERRREEERLKEESRRQEEEKRKEEERLKEEKKRLEEAERLKQLKMMETKEWGIKLGRSGPLKTAIKRLFKASLEEIATVEEAKKRVRSEYSKSSIRLGRDGAIRFDLSRSGACVYGGEYLNTAQLSGDMEGSEDIATDFENSNIASTRIQVLGRCDPGGRHFRDVRVQHTRPRPV